MQHKTQHTLKPTRETLTGKQAPRTNTDAFFAPPPRAKSGHAMASPASKFGSLLVLLAISSVAAVGVFMPDEDDPLTSKEASDGVPPQIHLDNTEKRLVSEVLSTPRNHSQQAYALAYELARQRVKTVGGLTREERLETMRQATAQVMTGDIAHLTPSEVTRLARQAPDTVKNAALQGVTKGEAKGISAQSQLVIERMLTREN